ncbi:MAG: hypothetical protein ACP5SA_01005 [Candidatus Micrarchaeia archaeon]
MYGSIFSYEKGTTRNNDRYICLKISANGKSESAYVFFDNDKDSALYSAFKWLMEEIKKNHLENRVKLKKDEKEYYKCAIAPSLIRIKSRTYRFGYEKADDINIYCAYDNENSINFYKFNELKISIELPNANMDEIKKGLIERINGMAAIKQMRIENFS